MFRCIASSCLNPPHLHLSFSDSLFERVIQSHVDFFCHSVSSILKASHIYVCLFKGDEVNGWYHIVLCVILSLTTANECKRVRYCADWLAASSFSHNAHGEHICHTLIGSRADFDWFLRLLGSSWSSNSSRGWHSSANSSCANIHFIFI